MFSRASAPFIKIPFSAPFPVPTIIAVGVANPKAQGQAIIRTDIKMLSEKTNVCPKTKYHIENEKIEIIKTAGTK